MSCEVKSMNKFRSSLIPGSERAAVNPLIKGKRMRGVESDNLTSIPIDRSEARTADHREGDRHRLSEELVKVDHGGRSSDAELINLSGGGAMVRVDFTPRLWDRVDLHLGEGSAIECAVRWVRGDRVGLEFAHETKIEGDAAKRDAVLLDVIQRTFASVEAIPAPPAPETNQPEPTEPDEELRRGDRRHPLIWTGQLLYNHDMHPVRLRNISSSGALVECAHTLPEGVEVMLDLGAGVQLFATVSWCRGDQSGLAFTEAFDLSRLADARAPEVAPQRWVRPGFLDATANQDSPWDRQWNRASLSELREDLEGFMKR
jgi:hypothetical protein